MRTNSRIEFIGVKKLNSVKKNYVNKSPKICRISTSFPNRFPKTALHCVPCLPAHWRMDWRPALLVFVQHLKILTIKNSHATFLAISPEQGREGCGKSPLESSAQSKAGFFFLWVISKRASLAYWFACSAFSAYNETGDRGAFWLQRQCQLRRVESRVTLLVESALILKCAINPSVGAPQPCPSTAYLPISPDGADSILSPVNQLLLWGSHCLSGRPCPPLLAVHLQASDRKSVV